MDPWSAIFTALTSEPTGWGVAGLIILVNLILVFRRILVPGTTHREIVSFYKERGDEFKAASDKKDETIASQAGALSAVEHFFLEVPVEERTMPKKVLRAGTADAPH